MGSELVGLYLTSVLQELASSRGRRRDNHFRVSKAWRSKCQKHLVNTIIVQPCLTQLIRNSARKLNEESTKEIYSQFYFILLFCKDNLEYPLASIVMMVSQSPQIWQVLAGEGECCIETWPCICSLGNIQKGCKKIFCSLNLILSPFPLSSS